MKKVYLVLLMLVAVALTASAAKHSAFYQFTPGGAGNPQFGGDQYNNYLLFYEGGNYNLLNTLKGYNGATTDAAKTVTMVQGFDNRFAFHSEGWNRFWSGNHHNVLWNESGIGQGDVSNGKVNLFTILNLRAGDIVRIHCYDYNNNKAMKDRFVCGHSDNIIDNRPWTLWRSDAPDLTYAQIAAGWGQSGATFNECTHEFIMTEDGNLDLNCAPDMELESVRITSPFVDYEQGRAEVGSTITTPAFWRNGQDDEQSGNAEVWWEWSKPVVLYRGDIVGSDNPDDVQLIRNSDGSKQVQVKNFTGKGGSVIIMCERYMYVYTIPYKVSDGSKAWNFWSKPLKAGRSTEVGTQGYDAFSLQAHDNAAGITKYGPLYTNSQGTDKDFMTLYQDKMNGQNSYVNEETAGLVFWTASGDKSYGYLNETLIDDGDGVRYLTIRQGGGFTIPGLKKGDQVYIYMGHVNNETKNGLTKAGVKFHVWNALDALKNPIGSDPLNTGDDILCGGSMWGPNINGGSGNWAKDRNMYGALHFYAAEDGDMRFRIEGNNNGYDYVKLYYIRIYKNEQDIIIQTDELLGNQGYEFLARQKADGSWEDSDTRTYNLRTVNHVSTNQRFEVLEWSGNLSKDDILTWGQQKSSGASTNDDYFEVKVTNTKPVYGAFMLRGKDYDHNNIYCMNYADRVIAVGTLQQMNYPYTWNFKDILDKDKGASGSLFSNETTAYEDSTRIWKTNGSNYEMNNSAFSNGNRNWSSGAQLYGSQEFIEEAAGVGFATWNQGGGNGGGSRNGDITITDEGVRIQPNAYGMTRVFVPNLEKGQKLYIQGKRYVNGAGGFGASYLTGKTYKKNNGVDIPTGPRINNPWNVRYRDDDGYDRDGGSWLPLLNTKIKPMTILLGEDEEEVVYDNFLYNFSSMDMEPGGIEENMVIDENITILATEEKYVTLTQGAPTPVDNTLGLFEYGSESTNTYGRLVYDKEGNIVLQYDENGNVVLSDNAVADVDGNLIWDNNVVLDSDNDTYTNSLKLNGQGSGTYRAAKLTLDPEKTYDITVVLKSQNSSENRVLMIYGDSWGGENPLATMIARNKLMSKTVEDVSGLTNVYIGSKDSGIEIYAIYVRESEQSTSVKAIPFIAYIDMKDAEFYNEDKTNVTMYLSDVLIEHMAVSMDEKKLNAIGWASESRQRYIDHSLNEVFNDVPVKAYLATGTGTDEETNLITSIRLTEVTSPMELSEADGADDSETQTGCILHNDDEKEATISLFVPAIHDYIKAEKINQSSIGNTYVNTYSDNETSEANRAANVNTSSINSMENNMMMANLNGTKVPYSEENADYCYYVLSYKWTDPQGITHPTEEELENGATYVEKFVRVATSGATMNKNSAYIRLPQASVNPHFQQAVDIIFDGEEGNLNGITDLTIGRDNSAQQGESDSYYTLSGQKINKPTVPGIYVKNGKKVYVK